MDKRMNFFIFVNLFVQSIVMHNNVSSNCWIKSKIENVGLFLVKKVKEKEKELALLTAF